MSQTWFIVGQTRVNLGLTGVAVCLSVAIKGQNGAIVGQRRVIVVGQTDLSSHIFLTKDSGINLNSGPKIVL